MQAHPHRHTYIYNINALSPVHQKVQGDFRKRCIPARVHGDAVPYGKSKKASADVIDWSSMLALGDVLDTINLWTVVPAKYLAKDFIFFNKCLYQAYDLSYT